jgi:hypothetical protein
VNWFFTTETQRHGIIKSVSPCIGGENELYGREIALIAKGEQQARNAYRVEFNASGIAPGIYFCRLTGCNSTLVKKILLY